MTFFSVEAFALQMYSDSLLWPVDYKSGTYWIGALDYYADGNQPERHASGYGIDMYSRGSDQLGNIYAIADGEIVYKYDGCGHENEDKDYTKDTCGKRFGNHIIIKHDDNLYSLYAHLRQGSLIKAKKVKAGDKIAEMGNSGMSTGRHLHFEIIKSISFVGNGNNLDYSINERDYAFDYYKYNTQYLEKFAFKNGLQLIVNSKYYGWINTNYTKTNDGYLKYKKNYHSGCTWNDSGYCTVGGEEYPISLIPVNRITYQAVKNDVPIRNRPYAPEQIINGLSKGTAVTVVAMGKNSKGNTWYLLDDNTWVYSENVKEAEKPSAPTGFKITKESSSTARLSWNPVPGATSYEVEYSSPTSNGWKTDPDYKDKTSTSYITTGLKAVQYEFRVRSVNSVGQSKWVTITYNGSTGAGSSGSVTKPNKPEGFTMTSTGERTARLSWNPATGATSYEVEYFSPTSNGWKIDPDYKDKASTSYITTDLVAKKYEFRIRAVNSAGKSDWVTITYDNSTGTSRSGPTTKPGKPTGLTMTRASDATARVSWNEVTNATFYEVEYSSPTSNGWKTDPDYKDKAFTSYITTGLNAKVYQFRVRAVNSVGQSDWITINYDGSNGSSW